MTKREQHLIADCRARKDEAWVRCSCGHHMDGATPEDTAAAFLAHRRANGFTNHGGLRSQGLSKQMRVMPRAAPDWTW